MQTPTMPRYFWMAIYQIAGGIVFMLLPERSETLIKFNSAHGPSMLDIIGLILIASGWLWLTVNVIARWRSMVRSIGTIKLYLVLLTYGLGILLVISGLKVESEVMLWTGVIISSISNLLLILQATKVDKFDPPRADL